MYILATQLAGNTGKLIYVSDGILQQTVSGVVKDTGTVTNRRNI